MKNATKERRELRWYCEAYAAVESVVVHNVHTLSDRFRVWSRSSTVALTEHAFSAVSISAIKSSPAVRNISEQEGKNQKVEVEMQAHLCGCDAMRS